MGKQIALESVQLSHSIVVSLPTLLFTIEALVVSSYVSNCV